MSSSDSRSDSRAALALKEALKTEGLRLGFQAVGIARTDQLSDEANRLKSWLQSGSHGTMAWMAGHFDKRTDPRKLVPGARTVISVLENYHQPAPPTDSAETGRISQYARGDDYHLVMRTRLRELLDWMDREMGGVSGRVFVDSAPVMDKAWAVRAGLGWIGKHSNVINQRIGSWFFIGELIVDVDILPDNPVSDLCGSCTRCIDACPTDAIVEPYVVDARKCISYLTIEHREDDIGKELLPDMGNWIFGCDICQDVCPWNKFATASSVAEYEARPGSLDTTLEEWSLLSEDDFDDRFRDSPVKRAKWSGFQRNVRIARTNAGPPNNERFSSSREEEKL